jgi:acetolactate synthase-1/2/3 large subunit
LHDSLVNYGENDPPMILCQHEKIAVQIAHGYARVKGKPMIAIVHNLVGLLHAPMGVYYSYLDRAPVFIMGATGPLAEPKRRPFIDWIHTANVQGEAIRNFVKWDYQPSTVDPGAFARALGDDGRAPGPIYMLLDAGLQKRRSIMMSKCRARIDQVPTAPSPDRSRWPKPPTVSPRRIASRSSPTSPPARRMVGATSSSWPKLWARRYGTWAHG